MKRYIILCLLSFEILSLGYMLHAAVGCLDDRLHVNECGVPRYLPVCCTCPCWRYEHSLDRNRCIRCWHFRDPQEPDVVSDTIDYHYY